MLFIFQTTRVFVVKRYIEFWPSVPPQNRLLFIESITDDKTLTQMAGSFAVYPGRSTLEEEYLESWFISFRSDYRLANIVRLQEGRNRTPRSRA